MSRILLFGTLILCLIVTFSITALLLYPFHPYTVYSPPEVVPLRACPEAEISVEVDSSISDGWQLNLLETESVWLEPGETEPEDGEGGTSGRIINPQPRERGVVRSPITRDAPLSPGVYRLYTEATIYGTFDADESLVSGFPKAQREIYVSEDYLTVLPKSHPECDRELASEGRG